MKLKRTLLACVLVFGTACGAVDVDALWNLNDPAASELRFREALTGANGDHALILRNSR